MSRTTHLSFHVPEAPERPGARPNFSYLHLSEAGAIQRPPIDVDAHVIHNMAYGLLRVLNPDAKLPLRIGTTATVTVDAPE